MKNTYFFLLMILFFPSLHSLHIGDRCEIIFGVYKGLQGTISEQLDLNQVKTHYSSYDNFIDDCVIVSGFNDLKEYPNYCFTQSSFLFNFFGKDSTFYVVELEQNKGLFFEEWIQSLQEENGVEQSPLSL